MRRLTAKTRAPRRVAGWALRRRSWMLGLLPLCYAGLSLLLSWRATIPAVIMVGYAVWLGLWAGRARHWGLVGVAAIYAGLAGAVWLGSSSAANPALLAPLWPRSLEMALVGIPGLAFWVMCAWAIGHRRWRMLNWLLGASVVAALLAAAPMLWSDWQNRVLDEPYSWQGAYTIWFVGVMVAGLGGLLIFGGGKVMHWIRRWRGRQTLRPTPA